MLIDCLSLLHFLNCFFPDRAVMQQLDEKKTISLIMKNMLLLIYFQEKLWHILDFGWYEGWGHSKSLQTQAI